MKLLALALAALTTLATQTHAAESPDYPASCRPDQVTLPFNPATPFYALLPQGGYEVLEADAYATRLPGWLNAGPHALLFVHGRGCEPTKSVIGLCGKVPGQALKELTKRQLRPMLFNWDSAAGGLDRKRPLANIEAAAAAFTKVLQAHAELRERKDQRDLPRPVLLVHSMGAWVIQRVVEQHAWPKTPQLFERIVFSEPDANREGHAGWMAELAGSESVWVTWNEDDIVLRAARSGRKLNEHPLGLGVPRRQALAKGVTYVDLSNVGATAYARANHTVFVAGSFGDQPHVDDFMGRLLAGTPINLKTDAAVKQVESRGSSTVIRLKSGPGDGPDEIFAD